MLQLKGPLQTKCLQPLRVKDSGLDERIWGNYCFFTKHITPQDLLHMAALPPEIYLTQAGDHANLSVINKNHQQVLIELVNQLINRLQLYGTRYFTYQDLVYVTNQLKQAGVHEPGAFLLRVNKYREESEVIRKLTKMYTDNAGPFSVLMRRTVEELDRAELPGKQGGGYSDTAGYYLQNVIYNRLSARELTKVMESCIKAGAAVAPAKNRREAMELTEYLRCMEAVCLDTVKREIFRRSGAVVYDDCLYRNPSKQQEITTEQAEKNLAACVLFRVVRNSWYVNNVNSDGRITWQDYSLAIYRSSDYVFRQLRPGYNRYAPDNRSMLWHWQRTQALQREAGLLKYYTAIIPQEENRENVTEKSRIALSLLALQNLQLQMTESLRVKNMEYIYRQNGPERGEDEHTDSILYYLERELDKIRLLSESLPAGHSGETSIGDRMNELKHIPSGHMKGYGREAMQESGADQGMKSAREAGLYQDIGPVREAGAYEDMESGRGMEPAQGAGLYQGMEAARDASAYQGMERVRDASAYQSMERVRDAGAYEGMEARHIAGAYEDMESGSGIEHGRGTGFGEEMEAGQELDSAKPDGSNPELRRRHGDEPERVDGYGQAPVPKEEDPLIRYRDEPAGEKHSYEYGESTGGLNGGKQKKTKESSYDNVDKILDKNRDINKDINKDINRDKNVDADKLEMAAWRKYLDEMNDRNIRRKHMAEQNKKEDTYGEYVVPNRLETRKNALYFLEHPEEDVRAMLDKTALLTGGSTESGRFWERDGLQDFSSADRNANRNMEQQQEAQLMLHAVLEELNSPQQGGGTGVEQKHIYGRASGREHHSGNMPEDNWEPQNKDGPGRPSPGPGSGRPVMPGQVAGTKMPAAEDGVPKRYQRNIQGGALLLRHREQDPPVVEHLDGSVKNGGVIYQSECLESIGSEITGHTGAEKITQRPIKMIMPERVRDNPDPAEDALYHKQEIPDLTESKTNHTESEAKTNHTESKINHTEAMTYHAEAMIYHDEAMIYHDEAMANHAEAAACHTEPMPNHADELIYGMEYPGYDGERAEEDSIPEPGRKRPAGKGGIFDETWEYEEKVLRRLEEYAVQEESVLSEESIVKMQEYSVAQGWLPGPARLNGKAAVLRTVLSKEEPEDTMPGIPMVYKREDWLSEEKLAERIGRMKQGTDTQGMSIQTVKTAIGREALKERRQGATEAAGGRMTEKAGKASVYSEKQIQEILHSQLTTQMNRITEQVYQKLEKRLSDERKRRGY